jgi:hypothetical protein
MIFSTCARDEHRHPDRNRQIGLAGARRADAEAKLILEQIGDIGLLRLGPGFDRLSCGCAVPCQSRTARSARAFGLSRRSAHAHRAVDVASGNTAARFESGVKGTRRTAAACSRLALSPITASRLPRRRICTPIWCSTCARLRSNSPQRSISKRLSGNSRTVSTISWAGGGVSALMPNGRSLC